MIRTGLLLGGGAARGAFQAGVVSALARAGLTFHTIVGTSVGAVNGTALLHGYGPELPTMWRENLRDVPWVQPRRLLSLQNPFLISEAMRVMVERYGDVPRILAHPTELLISATDWSTGRNVLFSTHDRTSGWTNEERVKQLLASMTIPLVCSERIIIRGRRYCDGALSDNLPVAPLLKAGCQRIVIVDPSPNDQAAIRTHFRRALIRPLSALNTQPTRIAAGILHALTSGPPPIPEVDVRFVLPPREVMRMGSLRLSSLEAINRALNAGEAAGRALAAELATGAPAAG